jgi:hypothetical protein
MVHLGLEHSNEAALQFTCELADLFKSQVIGVAAPRSAPSDALTSGVTFLAIAVPRKRLRLTWVKQPMPRCG